MPSLQSLLTALVSGLGMGSAYALVALGFTLVFSATGYFHLGVAAFVTLGSVGAYVGVVGLGMGWGLTILLVLVVGAVGGALTELITVRPVRNRTKNDRTAVMLTTMGFLIAVDSIAALWFGSEKLRVPSYWDGEPFQLGSVPVRRVFAVMIVVIVVVAVALDIVLRRTSMGRILRAAHDDPQGIELMGVNFQRTILISFALAGAFGVLAGLLMSPVTFSSAFVGFDLLLYGFAAMAIGGFGSFKGAIIGASAIGIVVAMTPLFVTPAAINPLVLLLVVVVLMIRPTGILGLAEVRKI
ncbi:branched-chain amino acid ABC transporter permease [Nakamurella alba]|nr:branched-chain amino acid ABC transporter permease [Nakamurella alba]